MYKRQVIYEPSFQELRNGLVSGTTLDNRGGCAALLLLAETLKEKPVAANIYIVATVQEEYNLRGACLAAEQIHPDAACLLYTSCFSNNYYSLTACLYKAYGEGLKKNPP